MKHSKRLRNMLQVNRERNRMMILVQMNYLCISLVT